MNDISGDFSFPVPDSAREACLGRTNAVNNTKIMRLLKATHPFDIFRIQLDSLFMLGSPFGYFAAILVAQPRLCGSTAYRPLQLNH
jgi:hypothetical protein